MAVAQTVIVKTYTYLNLDMKTGKRVAYIVIRKSAVNLFYTMLTDSYRLTSASIVE